MTTQSFKRDQHLRKRSQFQTVYAHGRRASGGLAIVFCMRREDALAWRLGLTATKKTVGKATARNRLRRRGREFFRRRGASLPPGWDFVVILKKAALEAKAETFARDLKATLGRLGFDVPLEEQRPQN